MVRHSFVVFVFTSALAVPAVTVAQSGPPVVLNVTNGPSPVRGLRVFVQDREFVIYLGETSPTGTFDIGPLDINPAKAAAYLQHLRDKVESGSSANAGLRYEVCSPDAPVAVISIPASQTACSRGCECAYEDPQPIDQGRLRYSVDLGKPKTGKWSASDYFNDPNTVPAYRSMMPRPGEVRYPRTGDTVPPLPRLTFEGLAGLKYALAQGFGTGVERLRRDLANLRYNDIRDDVKDTTWGGMVGAGVTIPLTRHIGLRAGVQYEDLGTFTASVDASRTNVPETPSNVRFTSDTTLEVKFFNVEVGVPISLGPVTITPNVVPGRASISSTTTSTLLGAPIGSTPTTPVNNSTVITKKQGWGVGFNIRGEYRAARLGRVKLSPYAQYQHRDVKDVFPQPNEARLDSTVNLRGLGLGLTLKVW